jgi:hypothetical protein
VPAEPAVSIVHDHYKETFALIRAREKTRDRSFVLLIGLFVLLALEVLQPVQTAASIRMLHVFGTDLDFSQIPLPYLLDASWVLTLVIALNYCRATAHVERQYPYLHRLEDWMSQALGNDDIYRREGRTYLSDYPIFLNWAWFAYVIVFPGLVMLGGIVLIRQEWMGLPYSSWHKLFDSGMGAFVIVSFLIYAVAPRLFRPFVRARTADGSRRQKSH